MKTLPARIAQMLCGLAISAVGVSFSLLAGLGASPVACCPAVYSAPLGMSVGTAMWLMCGLFVLAQIALLRRGFRLFELLQMPVAWLFGLLTDVSSALLSPLACTLWPVRIVYCAAGIALLGVGVWLLRRAGLLMLAPDALMRTVSTLTGARFSTVKVLGDCTMVAVAVIGSLVLTGSLSHVSLGTIAAALLVGRVVGLLEAHIS